jgi:hypothetical protein
VPQLAASALDLMIEVILITAQGIHTDKLNTNGSLKITLFNRSQHYELIEATLFRAEPKIKLKGKR